MLSAAKAHGRDGQGDGTESDISHKFHAGLQMMMLQEGRWLTINRFIIRTSRARS